MSWWIYQENGIKRRQQDSFGWCPLWKNYKTLSTSQPNGDYVTLNWKMCPDRAYIKRLTCVSNDSMLSATKAVLTVSKPALSYLCMTVTGQCTPCTTDRGFPANHDSHTTYGATKSRLFLANWNLGIATTRRSRGGDPMMWDVRCLVRKEWPIGLWR